MCPERPPYGGNHYPRMGVHVTESRVNVSAGSASRPEVEDMGGGTASRTSGLQQANYVPRDDAAPVESKYTAIHGVELILNIGDREVATITDCASPLFRPVFPDALPWQLPGRHLLGDLVSQ